MSDDFWLSLHVAATPKKDRPEQRQQEPMRAQIKGPRRNPSSDQKRVRRERARAVQRKGYTDWMMKAYRLTSDRAKQTTTVWTERAAASVRATEIAKRLGYPGHINVLFEMPMWIDQHAPGADAWSELDVNPREHGIVNVRGDSINDAVLMHEVLHITTGLLMHDEPYFRRLQWADGVIYGGENKGWDDWSRGMTAGRVAEQSRQSIGTAALPAAEPDSSSKRAVLESTIYEGEVGNKGHITMEQNGTIPTSTIAGLMGVSGERPGAHRNRQGAEWEDFKADIAANGITDPIFITIDYGEDPKISEGNHRRDAAVELGLAEVPVQIRYYGHAEQITTLAQKAATLTNEVDRGVLDRSRSYFIQTAEPPTLSGWKAHIYCEDIDDVLAAWHRVKLDVDMNDWGAKLATARFFEFAPPGHPQHGKGLTLYFPRRADWQEELDWLVRVMEGWSPRLCKPIKGDTYVDHGVNWRFDLSEDPGRDLDLDEARGLYSGAAKEAVFNDQGYWLHTDGTWEETSWHGISGSPGDLMLAGSVRVRVYRGHIYTEIAVPMTGAQRSALPAKLDSIRHGIFTPDAFTIELYTPDGAEPWSRSGGEDEFEQALTQAQNELYRRSNPKAAISYDAEDFTTANATLDDGTVVHFYPYGDAVPGGYNGGWLAMVDGKQVGYLDYQSGGGEVGIGMVEVEPEWQRRGVASALLGRLRREFPGKEIDPGMQTPEGSAWWAKAAAEDYQTGHQPMDAEDGAPPLHDMVDGGTFYGDDVYEHPEYYSSREPYGRESVRVMMRVRGKPEAMVTVYRAVPPDVPQRINTGDWVALAESYARLHAEGMGGWNEDTQSSLVIWPILSAEVPARTIFNGGNDLQEWGYFGPPVQAHKLAIKTAEVRAAAYYHCSPFEIPIGTRLQAGHGGSRWSHGSRPDMVYFSTDPWVAAMHAPDVVAIPNGRAFLYVVEPEGAILDDPEAVAEGKQGQSFMATSATVVGVYARQEAVDFLLSQSSRTAAMRWDDDAEDYQWFDIGVKVLYGKYTVKRWEEGLNWFIYDGDEYVGHMKLTEQLVVDEVWIDPAYRHKGLASAMFKVAQDYHHGRLTWPSLDDLTPAGAAWSAANGRPTTPGEEPGAFWTWDAARHTASAITPEQWATLDGIYEQSPLGAMLPEKACFEVSTAIARQLGWTQRGGYYDGGGPWGPEGHFWNEMPDGTIVDATHDQFDPEVPINVVEPGTSEHACYQTDELHTKLVELNKDASLRTDIELLRPQLSAAVQKIVDEWTQDEEGFDDEFGYGGACDQAADAMASILGDHGIETAEGGADGDDHAWVVALRGDEVVGVDIPPGVYETGGGYSWTKRQDVSISPRDVEVWDLDVPAENFREGAKTAMALPSTPGLYWRAQPKSRPFSAEDANSTAFSYDARTRTGYSCVTNPWYLLVYFVHMGWFDFGRDDRSVRSESDVVAFTGTPQRTKGVDGEPLVVPDMQIVQRFGWPEFEQELLTTPVPDTWWGPRGMTEHSWKEFCEQEVPRMWGEGKPDKRIALMLLDRYAPEQAKMIRDAEQWLIDKYKIKAAAARTLDDAIKELTDVIVNAPPSSGGGYNIWGERKPREDPDWAKTLSKVKTIYRGYGLKVTDDVYQMLFGQNTWSGDAKAEHILQLISTRGLGTHWTTHRGEAAGFAGMVADKGEVRVIVEASPPAPTDVLVGEGTQGLGIQAWDDTYGEQEIPIRAGAPLTVRGVWWAPGGPKPLLRSDDGGGWSYAALSATKAATTTAAPKLTSQATKFTPAQMTNWPTTKPWNLSRSDAEAQLVDGWWAKSARGTESASWEQGYIRPSPEFFTYPEETRRAIAYHEAGHAMLEAAGGLTSIEDPLALIDLPGADILGYNAEEIVAEGYSVLWTEPVWFDRAGADAVRSIVIATAARANYPLPAGTKVARTAWKDLDWRTIQIDGKPIELYFNSYHEVTASYGSVLVGKLTWWEDQHTNVGYEILGIVVDKHWQRKGLATAMLQYAREISGDDIHHSPALTDDGKEFAKNVAMAVPLFKGTERNMSERNVLAAANRILADIAREYGYHGELPAVEITAQPYELGSAAARSVDINDRNRDLWPNGCILLDRSLVERAQDKEMGYSEFRIIAHEAIHALIQREEPSYPGYSQMITEGGAEVLSVAYWAKRAPGFDDRDAVRINGKWVPGDIALVHGMNYKDWVRELMSRTASKVGWNIEAILREVQRIVAGNTTVKLDFRDTSNPNFSPPPGVENTAEGLMLWLIGQITDRAPHSRFGVKTAARYFHVAPVDAHDDIAQHGLDPGRGERVWPNRKYPKGTYLFGDERAANEYRRVLEEHELDEYGILDARKFEVWTVDLPESITTKRDPFRDDESGLGETSVFTNEPIPSSFVKEASWPIEHSGGLSLEAVISVAEQTMERAGLAGKTLHIPVGHVDDPAHQAALAPYQQMVSEWCGRPIRFYANDYILDTDGGGAQALTDGVSRIVVRPTTNEMTILHEAAHVILHEAESYGHTAEFVSTVEQLYRDHLGDAAADQFMLIVGDYV